MCNVTFCNLIYIFWFAASIANVCSEIIQKIETSHDKSNCTKGQRDDNMKDLFVRNVNCSRLYNCCANRQKSNEICIDAQSDSIWSCLSDDDDDRQIVKFFTREYKVKIFLKEPIGDSDYEKKKFTVEISSLKAGYQYHASDFIVGTMLSVSAKKDDKTHISLPIEFSLPITLDWTLASDWSFTISSSQSTLILLSTDLLQNSEWKFKISLENIGVQYNKEIKFIVKICSIKVHNTVSCLDVLIKKFFFTATADFSLPFLLVAQTKGHLNMTLMIDFDDDDDYYYYDGEVEVEVKMKMMEMSCAYWKEDEFRWDDEGCWALNSGPPSSTLDSSETIILNCHCSHLSIFSGLVQQRPVPINFSSSFNRILLAEPRHHTIFTLIVLWVIYGTLVVWALFKGKIDEYKAKPIDLADNSPFATKMYLLVVYTGKIPAAGTAAQVFVQFVGTRRKSDPHNLSCSSYSVLARSQRNLFIVRTLTDLGDLTHLRLWLCGKKDSWYLRYIEVLDLQTKKMFHFICEAWLSQDLISYKTIAIAKYHDLYGFKPLMSFNVCRAFEDWHNWISVFNTPVGDNFTRLQRLSRSFCMLLGNLMCTFMFFGKQKYHYELFGFGNIRITYNNISIAIYNSLLLGPIITTISLLFRYSKHPISKELVICDWKEGESKKTLKSLKDFLMFWRKTSESTESTVEMKDAEGNFSKAVERLKQMTVVSKFFSQNNNKSQFTTAESKTNFWYRKWTSKSGHKPEFDKNVSHHNPGQQSENEKMAKLKSPENINEDNNRDTKKDSSPDGSVIKQDTKRQKRFPKTSIKKREGLQKEALPRFGSSSGLKKFKNKIAFDETYNEEFLSYFEMETDQEKKQKSKTKAEIARVDIGQYEDPFDDYYGSWGLYVGWFITIALNIIFTIFVCFYTITSQWPMYKRWIIAYTTSFVLFLFVKDPATVIFLALLYSSIFKERMMCAILHVNEIRNETFEKMKTITQDESNSIKFKRMHEFYKPTKWSEMYQQKLLKRLEWDGGFKQFIYETIFYSSFFFVFLTLSLLLLNPQNLYCNLYFERILTRNLRQMHLKEDFWVWMLNQLVPTTYRPGLNRHMFETEEAIEANTVLLRAPCLHTVKEDLELWEYFVDHFGLFDSSTVCLTSHRTHSILAIKQLMNYQYLRTNFQGIGCSAFLYCLPLDFLINIFASLRLPLGGGVVFHIHITSVQLYLAENEHFNMISLVFLLSAILSILHIFHKMVLFGFGDYFCSLWNNVLLMIILGCLGMAITWWVFINQWHTSRQNIISNEDFKFHEFYQMNQLLSFPSTILLILYSWRLMYTFFVWDKSIYLFIIAGRSFIAFAMLSPYIVGMYGIIKAINTIRPTNRGSLSFLAQLMLNFTSGRSMDVGTHDFWSYTVATTLLLTIWYKFNICRHFFFAVVNDSYLQVKARPPDISSRQKYFLYILKWLARLNKMADLRKEFILAEAQKVIKQNKVQRRIRNAATLKRRS